MSMHAQKPDTTKVVSPIIVCKVKPGELAGFGNRSVKFIKVISDSRCPKGVTCVWAGEAKVLVEVYENGKVVGQKEVTIAPGGKKHALLSMENKAVQVYGLNPYPVGNTSIKAEEYVLNLIVTTPLDKNESEEQESKGGSSAER